MFWLSDHVQNNWRRGSGETMDIPNDILLFPRSLVLNCFVRDRSNKISIESELFLFVYQNHHDEIKYANIYLLYEV